MPTENDTPAVRLAVGVAKLQSHPALFLTGHAGTLKALIELLADMQRRLTELERNSHPPLGQDSIYARLEALERTANWSDTSDR